jgi:hypothetical protein
MPRYELRTKHHPAGHCPHAGNGSPDVPDFKQHNAALFMT